MITEPVTTPRPNNLEAEQGFLGALLLNNSVLSMLPTAPKPEDFFEGIHARIYEAALALIKKGETASAVTLKVYFEADETLREIGGPAYLGRLMGAAVTIVNAPAYAELICDCARRRRLIDLGEALINDASRPIPDYPATTIIADATSELAEIAAGAGSKTTFTFDQALSEAIDQLQGKINGTIPKTDIRSGLKVIDTRFSLFAPARFIIIAGRPGMGKTAIALELAVGMGLDGTPVGFMSHEMGKIELANRVLSSMVYESGAVSFFHIGKGDASIAQLDRICKAVADRGGLPIYGDEGSGLTLQDIRNRARLWTAQRQIKVLIVDYLGLVNASDRYRGIKVNEVGEISVGLKVLAKELGICVIALHQLSRAVENRDSRRPQLSDLRDSGNLEQDADAVCFLYRPAYYIEQDLRAAEQGSSEAITLSDQLHAQRHALDWIVAKNRGGPVGTASLWIDVASNVLRGEAA